MDQFMQGVNSALAKIHDGRKKQTPSKGDRIAYFAYGRNTQTEEMHKLCPTAKFLSVGTLYDFHMYFEEYANIRMSHGSNVVGVVWEIESNHLQKLDGDEALHKDYNRFPVEVLVGSKLVEAVTYVMDPAFESKELHHKPTKDYLNQVIQGYIEHKLPLNKIKEALAKS
jgi:gamma-glutamylcyclotransferase (GGCT)/AIG2-like uncharacterized protein YtfP